MPSLADYASGPRPDLPRITAQQFALWKHHPVTQVVRAFLEAYREKVLREHQERFVNGNDDPKLETRALGIALFTQEFLDLEYPSILKAYGEDDVGSADDGRPAQDPAAQPH